MWERKNTKTFEHIRNFHVCYYSRRFVKIVLYSLKSFLRLNNMKTKTIALIDFEEEFCFFQKVYVFFLGGLKIGPFSSVDESKIVSSARLHC